MSAFTRPLPGCMSLAVLRSAKRKELVTGSTFETQVPQDLVHRLEARETHLSPQRFAVDSLAYVSTRSGREACGPSGPSLVGSSGARLPPESGVDGGV